MWLINHFHVIIHQDPASWPSSAIESVQAFDIPEIWSGQVDLNFRTSGRVGLMLETRSAFEQVRSAAPYLLVERFGCHLKPGVDLLGAHYCSQVNDLVKHDHDSCQFSFEVQRIWTYQLDSIFISCFMNVLSVNMIFNWLFESFYMIEIVFF